VVDDDKILLTVLGRVLSGAGFAVATAADANRALQWLRQRNFDAVLSDLVLPGEGGATVIAEARRLLPAAVILCMSGQADIGLVGAAWEAGADDFIAKPFTAEALLNTLTGFLHARRAGSAVGTPAEVRSLVQSRYCSRCGASAWQSPSTWSEWRIALTCANCRQEQVELGRCQKCRRWGIVGETYSDGFGLCDRCAGAL